MLSQCLSKLSQAYPVRQFDPSPMACVNHSLSEGSAVFPGLRAIINSGPAVLLYFG